MEDKKINEETLNKIYRNAHIALQSISNLSEETDDEKMKAELKDQYDGYEKIIGEISTELYTTMQSNGESVTEETRALVQKLLDFEEECESKLKALL